MTVILNVTEHLGSFTTYSSDHAVRQQLAFHLRLHLWRFGRVPRYTRGILPNLHDLRYTRGILLSKKFVSRSDYISTLGFVSSHRGAAGELIATLETPVTGLHLL